MTSREEFEKDTGYSIQDDCYTNNRVGVVGPEDYWKAYALWQEKRNELATITNTARRGEKGERVNDKKIIRELRKLAEFQQTYIKYLLGSLSESEFMDYCEIIAGKVMSLEEIEKTISEANP